MALEALVSRLVTLSLAMPAAEATGPIHVWSCVFLTVSRVFYDALHSRLPYKHAREDRLALGRGHIASNV